MDLQVKVHHDQRVEKLFFSTTCFNFPRKESLVFELKQRIPKLKKITSHMILEYLDDEGDYCVLGDDEQSFQEMLNCAKISSSDSNCYRLNLKVTSAESTPTEEEKAVPSNISRSAAGAASRGQSRKKLSFPVHDETRPQGEHTSVKSPLESYVASQQEQIKRQTQKVEAMQRKVDAYKSERTPAALVSSMPVCSKCHLREGHNRLNCPYPLACSSSAFCKNIAKHPEEKSFLKELTREVTDESNKLKSMREQLNLKQQAASRVATRYANRIKDTLVESDPKRYTQEVNGKTIEDWRKINQDAKVLEKKFKGKIPSPEEAKKMLSCSSSPPELSIGKTSVHNPYKMLWQSHGVVWPTISPPQGSVRRTFSQCQEAGLEDWNSAQSEYNVFAAGLQDPSPVKSPMRKKSAIVTSFEHEDYDYRFALAVQESFKTLPPGFNVEQFEMTQQPSAQCEEAGSSTADEQSMPATLTTQGSETLNLDTLASAVSLLEKLEPL